MRRRAILARKALELKKAEQLKNKEIEAYAEKELSKVAHAPVEEKPKRRGRPPKKEVVVEDIKDDSPIEGIEKEQPLNDNVCGVEESN
jgi:hypothetical protein